MGKIETLGSAYGGWDVDLDLIPVGSTVISAGIGNDYSFDRELIERKGCFVVMVDPNQVAARALAGCDLPRAQFIHFPYALWTRDESVEFGAELSNGAGIFSSGRTLSVTGISLHTLLLGYPQTSLLKMDIEGAAYEVLEQYDFSIRPMQVAVGFHFSKRPEKIYDPILDRMRGFGYTVRSMRKEDESEMVILLSRVA